MSGPPVLVCPHSSDRSSGSQGVRRAPGRCAPPIGRQGAGPTRHRDVVVYDPGVRIGELADRAGTTVRTIRYYVAEGLLPAPAGSGPRSEYTDDHLARLGAIRALKARYLPLAEIRRRLAAM